MKKVFISFLLLLFSSYICAQNISVSSFRLLESDLTANTAGTIEIDQNGETAALIKVVTNQTGFTFDGGALGIVKTMPTPGEIWVYIPRGAKKLSVKHAQLGVLRDYYFPIPIEAARTYEMVLLTGEVQTFIKQTINSQYLVFKVTPTDAVVELDNEILPTSDGIAQKFVKFGTYEYRIQAQDYHTAAGKITVDDPNKKSVIEVNLKPAFGWIEIQDNNEYKGAQVFIDNSLVGTIPMKSEKLSSGEHNVKIVKSLYLPSSQTVIVRDNETTQVNPILSANFSEVNISVDNDAEIYINEEKKGIGSWKGKLETGSYLLEAKKDNHRNYSQTIEITSAQPSQNIRLMSPTPIFGEANIKSLPVMAEVYIDNEKRGETPLYLPQMLVGKHLLEIKSDNYVTYEDSIVIDEKNPYSIDVKLEKKNITGSINNVNNNIQIALSYNLKLNKIERTKHSTVLHMTYNAKKGDWLSISPETFIRPTYDKLKKFVLKSVNGIPLSPNKVVYNNSEEVHFSMSFDAIPENVTEIDLIEPDSPWQFMGIIFN